MMKTLSAMICSLAMVFAPLAAAQSQKPPAKAPESAPPAKVLVDIKADARTEACNRQAAEKKLTGEAKENFLTTCLKR
jgi:hypothetical protein